MDSTGGFCKYLTDEGVGTRRFFYPLHLQPCYEELGITKGDFPNSERAYNRGVSLPSSYSLTDDDLAVVCKIIKKYFKA